MKAIQSYCGQAGARYALVLALFFSFALIAQYSWSQHRGQGDGSTPLAKEVIEKANPDVAELAAARQSDRQLNSRFDVMRVLRPDGQGYFNEREPNNTAATATPLAGTNLVARGNIYPAADVDFYSFTAEAGDRIYAATMTSFSAASTNSVLALIGADGTTVVESDDDNGSFAATSSSIAGAVIPAAGTYYLRVNDSSATGLERPYELHFRIQRGTPTPEIEPNDSSATATPLPASGWVSGARGTTTDVDYYSITLNAGDSVHLGLDLDPERDATAWNGRLGFALFGDANNQIVVADDLGTAAGDTIPSEALFFTVKNAGTYYVYVDSASTTTGGATATYHLSVSVHPATAEGTNCTTYTSTDVPKSIGPGAGLVSSTITIPDNVRIGDLDVSIQLNHAQMGDIDAHLRSPADNDNGLFTDIGAAATGGQTMMDLILDDEAALTPTFTTMRPVVYKPELNYRLHWFDGENSAGTWTLDLRDDGANTSGGTLTGWSITICAQPPPPSCGAGFNQVTVFSTDFESGASGFTHSGTEDEWELGLPMTAAAAGVAPFTTCNSGTNCWKTDLDGTYNLSSSQDLVSPTINLSGRTGPLNLSWAHRYQMESASFDHYYVEVREVGNPANARKVFEFLDATMTNTVGNPAVSIGESAGWAVVNADISDFAGMMVEVRFHVDSETSVNLSGVAVDDVRVTACEGAPNDCAVCHKGRATVISPCNSIDYRRHLAHGDAMGPCPPPPGPEELTK